MMKTRRSRARISFMVMTVFAIVLVFVVRLVDIQLVQAGELNAQSLDKRAQDRTIYGVRGDIVDSYGAPLATSVDRYDITASPRIALARQDVNGSVTDALTRLAAVTQQDPAALMAILAADPESDHAYLKQSVTLEVYKAVQELDIPWIYYDLRPSRTYPNGAVAGNLVGYLGTDGPGGGIELSADDCLASKNGTAIFERSEDGVALPGSQVVTDDAVNGGTLKLTIDRDLNFYVQQRMAQTAAQLGATWATAVVTRVSDGHLMAVADYPSVDPNDVDGVPVTALGSYAFTAPYEPGSTMKALTAASLIDAGVATPATQVTAPGRFFLSDGSFIKDAWSHGDVNYTLAGALVDSSNIAFSLLTQGIDKDLRRDYMLKFGLDAETEVGFLGEAEGWVHPTQDWDERTNYTVGFGQGLTVTSVQLASAYQAIGNGGVRLPVVLVEGCEHEDGTVTDQPIGEPRRVVSEAAARQVLDMMEMRVTNGGDVAALTIPGYRLAAKSGTAEVAEDGAYVDKAVLSFAGLAPAENPQYVVIVTAGVPSTIYNSSAMAETFHDVMAQTLTSYRVQPSTVPGPNLPLAW
jgi:cell division protein FtsI (penicillin-binding protein 3)